MSHYTISYHDADMHRKEICEYAEDAYSAIEHSKEDVSYLKEHPLSIDYCKPDHKTEVENIYDFLSSGIPMGH